MNFFNKKREPERLSIKENGLNGHWTDYNIIWMDGAIQIFDSGTYESTRKLIIRPCYGGEGDNLHARIVNVRNEGEKLQTFNNEGQHIKTTSDFRFL